MKQNKQGLLDEMDIEPNEVYFEIQKRLKKHKHKVTFMGNGIYECTDCHERQGIKIL